MLTQRASATKLCPDDELIGLCHECDVLYLRFRSTFRDELTLNPDAGLQEKRELIRQLQRDVLEQICAIHATTLKGLRARNRVNLLDSLLDQYWTERMAEALHRDTTGQLAVVKDTGAQPGPPISIPIPPNESQRMLQDNKSNNGNSNSGPPTDRRRPDRLEFTNSDWIALLRDSSMAGNVYDDGNSNSSLELARTIVVRLVLSVPFWVALALLGYILLRTLGLSARS